MRFRRSLVVKPLRLLPLRDSKLGHLQMFLGGDTILDKVLCGLWEDHFRMLLSKLAKSKSPHFTEASFP
jgi:hypothetical protein